jgi:hypothetical protein
MALPTAPTATLGAVPARDVGRASGVSNTTQRFGGVFAAHGHFGSAASFASGYRPAIVVSAVISLAGAVAAVVVGHRSAAVAGAQAQVQPRAVVPSHHAAGDVPAAANTGADAS